MYTCPPVPTVWEPALSSIDAEVLPDPAEPKMSPPLPFTADSVRRNILPLLPLEETPVVNNIEELTPFAFEFED
jgi:hypothetical protein